MRPPSVLPMLNNIGITQIYVLDQDEALDFYVGKLGLEVHEGGEDGERINPLPWLAERGVDV